MALGAFIVIAMLALWFVLYLLRDQTTLEESPSHACLNNIRKLIEGQMNWAEIHDGDFANRFSQLYPTYVSSLHVFQCPAVVGEHLLDEKKIDELCEYEMVQGLRKDSPGDRIFIYDKEGNHKRARNVGFVDGTVEEMHENKFRNLLKKQKRGD
jgi:hypothetical protein